MDQEIKKRPPRWWIPSMIGVIAGALVWALSPAITGHDEPHLYFIICALALIGVLLGLYSRRFLCAGTLGLYVGQVIAVYAREVLRWAAPTKPGLPGAVAFTVSFPWWAPLLGLAVLCIVPLLAGTIAWLFRRLTVK